MVYRAIIRYLKKHCSGDMDRIAKRAKEILPELKAKAYVHLIFEIVRHDMAKEEAAQHMRFVSTLLYPGWKEIFGLG